MEKLRVSNDITKLHQLFGKKLYSDKFSFITEIVQNAVDSHRMAGVKKHVNLTTTCRNGRADICSIVIQDWGLSFANKEDFINKVCTIMESGKSYNKTSDEDCPMGSHGIGTISVSAFAPKWSYEVITPTGEHFIAKLMDTSEGLVYDIDDLGKTDKEKTVIFSVSNQVDEGYTNLIKTITTKLCYFKDIFFDFKDLHLANTYELMINTLNRDVDFKFINLFYKLYRTDDFQISTLSPHNRNQVHICLDQYYYPIDWDILGISPIPLNLALRFNMGEGLTADLTRENLQINKNYKSLVLDKLRKVADYLLQKYNEAVPDETESISLHMKNDKNIIKLADSITVDVNKIYHLSSISLNQCKLKGIPSAIRRGFRFPFLHATGYISHSGLFQNKNMGYVISDNKFILLDEPMKTEKKNYIKSEYHDYLLVEDVESKIRQDIEDDSKNVNSVYNHSCYTLLKDYIIKDYAIKLSDIKVPSTFKHKAPKRTVRNTISKDGSEGYFELTIYGSKKVVDMKDINKYEYILYNSERKSNQVGSYYTCLDLGRYDLPKDLQLPTRDKSILYGYVSKGVETALDTLNLPNVINVSKFMYEDNEINEKLYTLSLFKDTAYPVISANFCSEIQNDLNLVLKLSNFTRMYNYALSNWMENNKYIKSIPKSNLYDKYKEVTNRVNNNKNLFYLIANIRNSEILPYIMNLIRDHVKDYNIPEQKTNFKL